MPALDSILPMANLVSPGDGGKAMSSADPGSDGEPFDRVMTRALSPSETRGSAARARSGTVLTAPGEGKQNTISTPSLRRRIQARNAAAVPGATDNPPVQRLGDASSPKISESDAGKGRGTGADNSPVRDEVQVTSGGLPGVMVQLVATLPAGALPPLPPAAEMQGASDREVFPATPSPLVPAATAGKDSVGVLPVPTGIKTSFSSTELTSNPELSADKPAAELISSLKPDGQQSSEAKADASAAGKTNPGDSLSTVSLLVPEPTAEPAVSAPQNESSPAMDLSVKAAAPTQSELRGIAAAKLYLPMQKTEKMNKVAGLDGKTEKVLPTNADPTVPENNLPTANPLARIAPRTGQATIIIGPSTKGPEPLAASATDGASDASLVDLRSRALDRAHDIMALHAIRLVDSNLESVRVVIKPGAGLQLSLEMRQRGGTIDAQVIVQRGDFGHLSQHWPELQQRLEQRGIRLAPLASGENSITDAGANGFQQPQREFTHPDPVSASAFVGFALASAPLQSTTPSTLMVNAHRGWETWA